MICTLCLWEDSDTEPSWSAIAPDRQHHFLCQRHYLMYGHRYKSIMSIESYQRMVAHGTMHKEKGRLLE